MTCPADRPGIRIAFLVLGISCIPFLNTRSAQSVGSGDFRLTRQIDPGLVGLIALAVGPGDEIVAVGATELAIHDSMGQFVRRFRLPSRARSVAVAKDGTMYVAMNQSIHVYDPAGSAVESWGDRGSGRGQFGLLTSLAITNDFIYIADAGNRRIHRFAINGDFIDEFAEKDDSLGEEGLIVPSPYLDLTIDAKGRLLHANPGRFRIEIRDAGGTLLRKWGRWGQDPAGFCGCCNPTNLAVFPDGRVVTSEKGIPRIKIHDAQGHMIQLLDTESIPAGSSGLDLAVDSHDNLYVVEPTRGLILVYQEEVRRNDETQ